MNPFVHLPLLAVGIFCFWLLLRPVPLKPYTLNQMRGMGVALIVSATVTFGCVGMLVLAACSKEEPKKEAIKLGREETDPNAKAPAPVELGTDTKAQAKNGAYRGLDPAKVEKLSPEARKMLEESDALAAKSKANPNMNGAEFMKAAGGGRELKQPKF